MIAVGFQPSGWSRGSYLNVGCMWLWNVKPHISFDEGNRVGGFFSFESEDQFRSIAEELAQRAAERVTHYRRLFPTIRNVSDFYLKNPPHAGWPSFNAAVAHGLCGRIRMAKSLFNCWGDAANDEPEWVKQARLDSDELAAIVDDQEGFRKSISNRVLQTRKLRRLPVTPEVDFFDGARIL
jgi:hypothetical protein